MITNGVASMPDRAVERRTAEAVPLGARLGGLGIVIAALIFAAAVAVAASTAGAAYVWPDNMISDLGDSSCRVRGGRWICSPAHALFNAGVMLAGLLIAVSALLLRSLWGALLSVSVVLMGVGLLVAGGFNAGDFPALHLAGVILALVVPAAGLMVSGFRPSTGWLMGNRWSRALLGGVALVLCAESRLPDPWIPQGAGQVAIVACVLIPFLTEAARLVRVSR